jgi:cytochrome d ubiquinol oxidase subunit I
MLGLEIPRALSLLAKHDPNAPVTGLDAVPPPDRPPVGVVRVSFELMVLIGTALALLGAGYLFVRWRRRRLPRSVWFYRALVAAGPLSVVALIAGWTVTEVGRQPWIVYQTMRTSQAVTAAGNLPVAFVVLILAYLGLTAVVVWLLRRLARQPLERV